MFSGSNRKSTKVSDSVGNTLYDSWDFFNWKSYPCCNSVWYGSALSRSIFALLTSLWIRWRCWKNFVVHLCSTDITLCGKGFCSALLFSTRKANLNIFGLKLPYFSFIPSVNVCRWLKKSFLLLKLVVMCLKSRFNRLHALKILNIHLKFHKFDPF